MKYCILGLFLLVFGFCQSQGADKILDTTNYVDYYQTVNKAETLFFMKEQPDSALTLFDKVFESYDFVYVTDLMEAAQIAKFEGEPYKKYLERGFWFGLKLDHLKNYPLVKDELKQLRQDETLQKSYQKGRKAYMKSIDFDYLKWIYHLFIKDQLDKSKPRYKYRHITNRSLRLIKNKILHKGFPGERILGIPDSTIFAEQGIYQLDLKEQIKKYGKKLWYVKTEDKALSQALIFVLLVHNPCAYGKLKNLLWKEMLRGNLYPRSLGMLYDNTSGFSNNPSVTNLCHSHKKNAYFRLNAFTRYPKETEQNIKATNALRKEFYIVPLEVDKKKKEFEKKHGFILFTRFFEPLKKAEPAGK